LPNTHAHTHEDARTLTPKKKKCRKSSKQKEKGGKNGKGGSGKKPQKEKEKVKKEKRGKRGKREETWGGGQRGEKKTRGREMGSEVKRSVGIEEGRTS